VKSSEANILGFNILIDSLGIVVTEMSGIPEGELHKVFKDEDLVIMRQIIRAVKPKLEVLHEELEQELAHLR
jgi:hypothetical protein